MSESGIPEPSIAGRLESMSESGIPEPSVAGRLKSLNLRGGAFASAS